MIHRIVVIAAVVALGQAQMAAQIRLAKTCTVHFATPEQGKSRLAKHDAYIKGLSPFERAAKIQKAGPVSTEQYIEFIQKQTLQWTDDEKAKLKEIILTAAPKLTPYSSHFPSDIYLIKTTGKDEGGARTSFILAGGLNEINVGGEMAGVGGELGCCCQDDLL